MAPDVQYSFDHHIACGNITGDIYSYFVFFNGNTNEWFDSLDHGIDEGYNRMFRYQAGSRFLKWFYRGHDDQRAYCILDGLWSQHHFVDDTCKELVHEVVKANPDKPADDLIEDFTTNLDLVLTNSQTYPTYQKNVRALLRRAKRFSIQHLKEVADPSKRADILGIAYRDGTPVVRPKVKIDKKERKVLKRSASILDQTLGEKKSSMFVSGEKITVEGTRFNFECGKGYSKNHISLSVYDKQDEKFLVNLCWYIEDTPAMDQIVALAMMVMAGEEDEIIRVGNFMSDTTVLIERYPEFKSKTAIARDGDRIITLDDLTRDTFPNHTKYCQVLNNVETRVIERLRGNTADILEDRSPLLLSA